MSIMALVFLMTPQPVSPDWAISQMQRITKYDDPDLLDAVLELLVGISGLSDKDKTLPTHIAEREDAVQAALEFGYRRTADCAQHCEEYLGLTV